MRAVIFAYIIFVAASIQYLYCQDSIFVEYQSRFYTAVLTDADSCSKPIFINPASGREFTDSEFEDYSKKNNSISPEDVERFIYPKNLKKTVSKYNDQYSYGLRIENTPCTYCFVTQWSYKPGEWGDLFSTLLLIYDSVGTLLSRETLDRNCEIVFDGETWLSDLCINKSQNKIKVIQARNNRRNICTVEYIEFTIERSGRIVKKITDRKKGKLDFVKALKKFRVTTINNEVIYFESL